jgi:Ni,Fe-hydrogenase maturation factor
MKIFYFGNPFIKEDSLAVKVAEKLKPIFKNVEFEYIKDTFQLLDTNFKDSLMIDVFDNIKEVSIISSNNIKSRGLSSTHDFDLGFFLKLTNQKANIIGIPKSYDETKALEEVKKIIIDFLKIQS